MRPNLARAVLQNFAVLANAGGAQEGHPFYWNQHTDAGAGGGSNPPAASSDEGKGSYDLLKRSKKDPSLRPAAREAHLKEAAYAREQAAAPGISANDKGIWTRQADDLESTARSLEDAPKKKPGLSEVAKKLGSTPGGREDLASADDAAALRRASPEEKKLIMARVVERMKARRKAGID